MKITTLFFVTMVSGLLAFPGVAITRDATTLDYDAYIGERKVGEAEITVAVADSEYEISGQAKAVGMTRFFTKWRSFFRARGFFGSQGPKAEEYRVEERIKKKSKAVFLADGRVNLHKNGIPTRSIEALSSPDLLTALFAAPDCRANSAVHNGKDLWQLTLVYEAKDDPVGSTRCAFDVVDEDDEAFTATVWFNEMGGLMLPVRLELNGAVQGHLQLRKGS